MGTWYPSSHTPGSGQNAKLRAQRAPEGVLPLQIICGHHRRAENFSRARTTLLGSFPGPPEGADAWTCNAPLPRHAPRAEPLDKTSTAALLKPQRRAVVPLEHNRAAAIIALRPHQFKSKPAPTSSIALSLRDKSHQHADQLSIHHWLSHSLRPYDQAKCTKPNRRRRPKFEVNPRPPPPLLSPTPPTRSSKPLLDDSPDNPFWVPAPRRPSDWRCRNPDPLIKCRKAKLDDFSPRLPQQPPPLLANTQLLRTSPKTDSPESSLSMSYPTGRGHMKPIGCERPTLTFVFRGKRITRPNPYYNMTSHGPLDFEADNDGSVDRLVLDSQPAGQWRES
ncbi:hypothetical protein R3P38DRAFT_3379853 [Favolaschia claudopus]|uniref:Uncharacterized protein n=1 Tax=Favolaschia claudopus TaxID=2862362 RepID=A0AAV9Z457_9AGAR